MLTQTTLLSRYDDLSLSVMVMTAEGETKGVLQIVHGMAEHKERYLDFMKYLSKNGYASVIHDHRGHGKSIKSEKDLGYMYSGGWKAMVDDVLLVQEWIKKQYPSIPTYLMGHSMGSMVVRSFTKRYDSTISGLIVCGCPADNPAKGFGKAISSITGLLLGDHHPSKLMNALSFGSYNKPFKSEGENAWLSANHDNVIAYNADPLCGFCFSANGFKNLMGVMSDCYSPKGWEAKNKELPVHFISGGDDPCRINDKSFYKAVNFMKERGYKSVSSKLYPGLRHEILLEKTAEEVFGDVVSFLNSI